MMGAGAARQEFTAGWYGKIPGTGDFVPRRVSASFSAAWDRWLQAALAGARAWFSEIEAIALCAIAPAVDSAAIDAAIVRQPFRSEWLRYPDSHDDTLPIRGTKPQMLWISLPAGPAERHARELGVLAE